MAHIGNVLISGNLFDRLVGGEWDGHVELVRYSDFGDGSFYCVVKSEFIRSEDENSMLDFILTGEPARPLTFKRDVDV